MTYKQILDHHQQLRLNSCFQMAPELALKLAGILDIQSYPFQDRLYWDKRGYEPYSVSHIVEKHLFQFETITYQYPYDGMFQRFQEELDKGCFPIVSLAPVNPRRWHGYVIHKPTSGNDFVILTKIGSHQHQPCLSQENTLNKNITNKLKVDCLFWKATNRKNTLNRLWAIVLVKVHNLFSDSDIAWIPTTPK